MKVHEAMSSEVVSVSTITPFRRIVELMTEHHISGLPVVDGEGCVAGVVTEADVVVKEHRGSPVRLHGANKASRRRREFTRRVEGSVAGELMSTPAITVDADDDLRVAARLMSLHGIRRLPVTTRGKLVGIIARADVLKIFLRQDEDIRREIEDEILGRKIVARTPDVHVSVTDGVVLLRGSVPCRSTALVIGYHIDRLDGVTRVENRLVYQRDDMESEQDPVPPMGPVELRL